MRFDGAVNTQHKHESGDGLDTELAVSGMTCSNCARHVSEAVQAVKGVHSALVSLDTNRVSVRWSPGSQVQPDILVRAIQKAGYEATETAESKPGKSVLGGWRLNVLLGVPVTAILMLGEWALGLGLTAWFRWVSFVLAAVVQVFAGARFYRGAWMQLKAGSSSMDTLVALGSSTAFLYSTWALFVHSMSHLYFMEAAAIITLISIGHWLESRMSARASSALRQLLDLAPSMARRKNADGTEKDIPSAQLQVRDLVSVRAGDRIPTDGVVVEGGAAVDESMLTGESVPVDKVEGSPVYAGTLNASGKLAVRVTATGAGTALAQVIAAVQRAQSSRANIQRLGDTVASVFVPIVVIIAIAAGLWWGLAPASANHVHEQLGRFLWNAHVPSGAAAAFIVASAVLIIACPCAMGLATPVAIMAGSNAAAKRGILIRDGVALEKAGTVTAVLFDKTGTLTMGKPQLAATWESSLVASGLGSINAIQVAGTLARHSTHPVSQALAFANAQELASQNWQEVHGAGIQAEVQWAEKWHKAQLGSVRWLKESGVDLPPGKSFIKEWSEQGATMVGLAVDKTLAALFAVKDQIKPGAKSVVSRLERQGLNMYLVTGDNAITAAAIAREVGIPEANVFAEVKPADKAKLVRQLQNEQQRVAFVGDGINDAPALEQADLGVAVSRASDIAREAADIILLKSEIEAVPESLGLARSTLRTIKQNLFWAFFYNAAGIPLAALGFMSPILCAAAMGLSDVVVIGNALRLRNWRLSR